MQLVVETPYLIVEYPFRILLPLHSKDYALVRFGFIYNSHHLFLYLMKSIFLGLWTPYFLWKVPSIP
jgi:hypothetical protein